MAASLAGAPRAVCVVSGGPDSAVTAAIAQAEGLDLYFLFVDYGQKTRRKELECARALAEHFGAREMRETRLDWFREVTEAPLISVGSLLTVEKPELIYVPFRNTVLLSLAVAWAEAMGGATVFIGSIGPPWATPDNSPDYFAAFNELVRVGAKLGASIPVRAPLCTSSKGEVVERGSELGVPFELTWSCQNFEDVACGACTGCVDRRLAFEAAHLVDPVGVQPTGLGGHIPVGEPRG